MLAIELSTSSDWAREIRGTASIASAVIGRRARSSTRPGRSPGLRMLDQCGAVSHGVKLVSRRRVDTEHDVGLQRLGDRRPSRDVHLVGELRPRPGAGLHYHVVAQLNQLRCCGRRRGHTSLAGLQFPYHSDDQCLPPQRAVAYPRSQAGPQTHQTRPQRRDRPGQLPKCGCLASCTQLFGRGPQEFGAPTLCWRLRHTSLSYLALKTDPMMSCPLRY